MTKLPENKSYDLCKVAGNFKVCKLCYRNPENRVPADKQGWLVGTIYHEGGEYKCTTFQEAVKWR